MQEKGGKIKERGGRGKGKGDRGKIQEEEVGGGEMRVKILKTHLRGRKHVSRRRLLCSRRKPTQS
jgi:hypothetical protein